MSGYDRIHATLGKVLLREDRHGQLHQALYLIEVRLVASQFFRVLPDFFNSSSLELRESTALLLKIHTWCFQSKKFSAHTLIMYDDSYQHRRNGFARHSLWNDLWGCDFILPGTLH